MIDVLKGINANPEYKVIVWYSHIQSHFRYAGIIWNNRVIDWGDREKQMKLIVGKLVTVYNKLYKNALNLNTKMEN